MNQAPFKKQIPADFVPNTSEENVIASTTYKSLAYIGQEIFFIRFYNCGVHFSTFEVAREKYNELTAIKR